MDGLCPGCPGAVLAEKEKDFWKQQGRWGRQLYIYAASAAQCACTRDRDGYPGHRPGHPGGCRFKFSGAGGAAPMPVWGSMLSDGKIFLQTAPHLTIFPGLAILITVLSFNFLGDGLRDVFDPRLREKAIE